MRAWVAVPLARPLGVPVALITRAGLPKSGCALPRLATGTFLPLLEVSL